MKLGKIIEKPNNTSAKCKCGKIAKFKTKIQQQEVEIARLKKLIATMEIRG